ncbi:MAG: tRNA guanosine(34) transglycosylase Tgt [Saprospirales bacterium]|nr:MAG: tRNA guanosine(34) transglycosylase Tgt [Saprospirales bacterium]
MEFKIQSKSSEGKSRAGTIRTEKGEINTPVFMPVGTIGSVKGLNQQMLKDEVGAPIILGNTYHLYLRPGTEILNKGGGLHKFINWDGHMLTDSGGYQVYSLSNMRKITEEGVWFQSHIDGSRHFFSPENVMDIQRQIGADFIMAFDECPPFPAEKTYVKQSMEMTHRWLKRCNEQFDSTDPLYGYKQYLFPIVQGGTFKDLRSQSAQIISEMDFPANAIGGLSVGEPADVLYDMTDLSTDYLTELKPRYLMGVGTPADLLECIDRGIDMFDCVLPTRNARHGLVYTINGIINIKNAKWADDFSPLDPDSPTEFGRNYSKAYVRHLFHSGELLGPQIASVQNLTFYLWLVNEARKAIAEDRFTEWKNSHINQIKTRI